MYAKWECSSGSPTTPTDPDPAPTDPAPKEETFDVTFDKNASDATLNGKSSDSCTTTTGSCRISGLPSATRDGYEFIGWYTAATGGTQITLPFVMTENVTLYAHWKLIKEKYTVTYDPRGGTVSKLEETVTAGDTIQEFPVPEREGYTFVGWFKEQGDGTGIYVKAPYTPPDDVELYASWIPALYYFYPKLLLLNILHIFSLIH